VASVELPWSRLGELLIERGALSPEQLELALEEQRRRGDRLGHALVALGFVSEAELMATLLEQVGVGAEAEQEQDEAAPELLVLEPVEPERESEPDHEAEAPKERRRLWARRNERTQDPELERAIADFERRSTEVEQAIAEVRAALRELQPAG
jgi:hypothetical protein